jgi:hypothetical protein
MHLKEQINELYKPSGSFIFNYLIPIVIIVIWLYNVISLLIKIEINSTKTTWSQQKCNPKYLFISGLIQTEPGKGVIQTTKKNFKQCVIDASKT